MLLTKLDELGKVAWLATTVAAFVVAWPVGLAMLAYLGGSGRVQAWYAEHADASGAWFNVGCRSPASGSESPIRKPRATASGNKAFDDYRADAMSRLEEEGREFRSFLERLRQARDKAEFDGFMAERRQRPATTGPSGKDTSEPAVDPS